MKLHKCGVSYCNGIETYPTSRLCAEHEITWICDPASDSISEQMTDSRSDSEFEALIEFAEQKKSEFIAKLNREYASMQVGPAWFPQRQAVA